MKKRHVLLCFFVLSVSVFRHLWRVEERNSFYPLRSASHSSVSTLDPGGTIRTNLELSDAVSRGIFSCRGCGRRCQAGALPPYPTAATTPSNYRLAPPGGMAGGLPGRCHRPLRSCDSIASPRRCAHPPGCATRRGWQVGGLRRRAQLHYSPMLPADRGAASGVCQWAQLSAPPPKPPPLLRRLGRCGHGRSSGAVCRGWCLVAARLSRQRSPYVCPGGALFCYSGREHRLQLLGEAGMGWLSYRRLLPFCAPMIRKGVQRLHRILVPALHARRPAGCDAFLAAE